MTNIPKFQKESCFGWVLVFLLLIIFDQLIKNFVKNIFLNHNFAFSIPLPIPAIYLIYFIVIFFIFRYLWKQKTELIFSEKIAWMLILSGAVSNIGERLYFGFVRDWIYISAFGQTGIYNLADGYIIIGIVFLIVRQRNKLT